MQAIETIVDFKLEDANLMKGARARIKETGQIVELKEVSEHGISKISFRTGGEYFISNKSLEPVAVTH